MFCDGIMSLEKAGTHHNPSDVLTKFVQAAVLGQHLQKLNLFEDPSLSQVFKYGLGMETVKTVESEKEDVTVKGNANFCANHAPSRVYQQAYSQHHDQRFVQGHVCMLNFDSFEDHRERDSYSEIQACFTPNQKSIHITSASRERVVRIKRFT